MAAYESFFEYVKEPRQGKTIFITAASGGVGQVVGQLAKMHGMKVIGSTGSQEKVDFVKGLGCKSYVAERTTFRNWQMTPIRLPLLLVANMGGGRRRCLELQNRENN